MKYFETLIPKITEAENTYFDMFFHFDITNDIDQEFLVSYSTKDGETLQNIALFFYDDPQLWWLIALTNKIEDTFFDLANTDEYIQKVAVELASFNPLFWTGDDSDLFWTGLDNDLFWYLQEDYLVEYENESLINDEKRDIIIIKAEYLSEVISIILEKAGSNE